MAKGRDWREALTEASNRGLTVRAFAREIGVHNKVVYDAEKTYGIRLPRREERQSATFAPEYVPDGTEQWRVIPGYERYEASSLGRIRSIRTGKCLAQQLHKESGYYAVALWAEGAKRGKTRWAHCWIATAFHANPDGLPQVNHKDRVRTNNDPDNLEWITRAENYAHGIADERLLSRSNPNVQRKLAPADVAEIMRNKPTTRGRCTGRKTAKQLSEQFGVGHHYITRIWRGEKRQHDTQVSGSK